TCPGFDSVSGPRTLRSEPRAPVLSASGNVETARGFTDGPPFVVLETGAGAVEVVVTAPGVSMLLGDVGDAGNRGCAAVTSTRTSPSARAEPAGRGQAQ